MALPTPQRKALPACKKRLQESGRRRRTDERREYRVGDAQKEDAPAGRCSHYGHASTPNAPLSGGTAERLSGERLSGERLSGGRSPEGNAASKREKLVNALLRLRLSTR
jgi:hypothetical protein